MNKRANLYFAALLGAMSPLSTVTALAAQSNSAIATATQQQNSCKGTVKDASGEPIIGATIRIDGKTGGTVTDRIDIDSRAAIACMLGGPDRRTLFLLSSADAYPARMAGTRTSWVQTVRVDVPGIER